MYEGNFIRNLGWYKNLPRVSLFYDLFGCVFDFGLGDVFVYLLRFIYPVINSDSTLSQLLYLISQFQAWHLSFPKYFMKCRCADLKFLSYASLLFIVIPHPYCKFIQFIPLFFLFFCTNIQDFDTVVSISIKRVIHNFFQKIKENALTYIKRYVTI